MLDIFNTKKLEATKTALANAQAQAAANAKKTKTAAIIGGSTTAAAAAVAGLCFFTGGRKINRNKLKNYDNILEERNKAIDDATNFKTRCEYAENLAVAADGCCQKLANSIRTKNSEEMHAAMEGHNAIHKEIFGDISEESFNAAVAAYDEFIKSLTAQDQQNAQIPQNNQNAQNAQIPQNNQNAQNQNDQAQKIADAQNRYNDACAKAGAAKTAFENAEKKLAAAKASNSTGDHSALEAAVTAAKAAFEAADKERVDAKNTLDALQANQQN